MGRQGTKFIKAGLPGVVVRGGGVLPHRQPMDGKGYSLDLPLEGAPVRVVVEPGSLTEGPPVPAPADHEVTVRVRYADGSIQKMTEWGALEALGAQGPQMAEAVRDVGFTRLLDALRAARSEPRLSARGAQLVAQVEGRAAGLAPNPASGPTESTRDLALLLGVVLQARLQAVWDEGAG